jgi:hypothetical protein
MRGLAIFYVLLCLAICVTLVRVRLINMRRAQCELRRREALRVTASIETLIAHYEKLIDLRIACCSIRRRRRQRD